MAFRFVPLGAAVVIAMDSAAGPVEIIPTHSTI